MNLKGIKILLSAYKMLMFMALSSNLVRVIPSSRPGRPPWKSSASLSATDHKADESNLSVPWLFPL